MRGVAAVIFYLLGLGAIISFSIASLMALQSPTIPTPSAPVAAAAPHKERAAKPVLSYQCMALKFRLTRATPSQRKGPGDGPPSPNNRAFSGS
jgi:hypothetical protein